MAQACVPATWEAGVIRSEVQGQPRLLSGFKVSLDSLVTHCLKVKEAGRIAQWWSTGLIR